MFKILFQTCSLRRLWKWWGAESSFFSFCLRLLRTDQLKQQNVTFQSKKNWLSSLIHRLSNRNALSVSHWSVTNPKHLYLTTGLRLDRYLSFSRKLISSLEVIILQFYTTKFLHSFLFWGNIISTRIVTKINTVLICFPILSLCIFFWLLINCLEYNVGICQLILSDPQLITVCLHRGRRKSVNIFTWWAGISEFFL